MGTGLDLKECISSGAALRSSSLHYNPPPALVMIRGLSITILILYFQAWIGDIRAGTTPSCGNHIKSSCHLIAFKSDRPGRKVDIDSYIVILIRMGQKGRLISGWRLRGSSWGSEVSTMKGLRPLQTGQVQ